MEKFWSEISSDTYSDNARIQVYQTNFQATKLNALSENFPLTKLVMGESLFTAISKHFIQHIGSINDSLNVYGIEFPDFLKEIIPYNPCLKNKRYLVGTALFDWAVMQSYFAMNDDPLSNWSLNTFGERAYLRLAEHVNYVCLDNFIDTPFNSVNHAKQEIFTSQEFCKQFIELTSTGAQLNQQQVLLVYREEFDVNVMTLSAAEDEFFLLLRERTPFFLLEEQLAHIASPEMISLMITKFKQAGILIGISEPNHD